MSRFILVRVVIGFCLLLVLSTVTFAIYASIPVEPAGFLVDLQHATPAQIAAAHQALGLDHSIYYRYGGLHGPPRGAATSASRGRRSGSATTAGSTASRSGT